MVTCGFSFGDQHLNDIIFGTLDTHNLSHLISLQYEDISEEDELVKAAKVRPNLMVIGRNAGVIKGCYGEWQLVESVSKQTYHFMDICFDSDAEPDITKQSLTGIMRIGDYNRFCKAIVGMGGVSHSSEHEVPESQAQSTLSSDVVSVASKPEDGS